LPYTGRQSLGTIIAKSILENHIEADHRRIKQGVRVMQRFQMVRNAQVIRVGIELAYHFGKEKKRRLERAIGVIYRPETELQSHYFYASLPQQFDEYIWFDETRAVEALTRRTTKDIPDTFPFGL